MCEIGSENGLVVGVDVVGGFDVLLYVQLCIVIGNDCLCVGQVVGDVVGYVGYVQCCIGIECYDVQCWVWLVVQYFVQYCD